MMINSFVLAGIVLISAGMMIMNELTEEPHLMPASDAQGAEISVVPDGMPEVA